MRSYYVWLSISVTVCAAATGDVLVALAMRRIGDLGELRRRSGILAVIARILSSGVFFGGVLAMAIAFFSNLMGLSWADLSLMGPATAALTFVANGIAAKLFLHENVDRRRWLATLFVCCGVFLLT
ncbi:MAG TPA: EamA family transporter [Terriglobales bacterium]|nr:EamA family transporter [Terriglobales bacterium]